MSEKPISQEPLATKETMVEDWLGGISSEKPIVSKIEPALLRDVLTSYGADFQKVKEAEASLGAKYKYKNRREGLKAIWGENRVKEFESWTERFAKEFEVKEGNRTLPRLTKKENGKKVPIEGSQVRGMLQFFAELTQYAAGLGDLDVIREQIEVRAENGRLWNDGESEKRGKIYVPTAKKPIYPASFPPGFPKAFLQFIKG